MYNIITIEDINIENLIYEINGKQVMLDSDLAFLYRCKNGTKEVNQAVKNNPAKFPDRFSWRLSEDETKFFLVKYFDQKRETRGGRFNKPRVFTEQGVAMLATILKTSVATEISIKIMDAFVTMRHYIGNNESRINNIETKIIEHDNNIKLLQKSFDNLEKNKEINEIYFKGKIYDAYSKVLDIFKTTKKELIIIDRYTDKTVLDMIKELKCKVIIITGSNSRISKLDLLKYIII